MANTQAFCTSAKVDLFNGTHAIGTPPVRATNAKDVFKAALFYAAASLGAATTAYGTTNEVVGTGYTAGGVTITNATAPSSSGTTAFWTPSASLVWTGLTAAAFDAVQFYNSTQADASLAIFTFGSQSITAGNLTLGMPTNDASTGLIRIA